MFKLKILPIFQLPRVLFPKMILPLHIFEARYKKMIKDCLENDSHFGIISEAESRDELVGTTASIHRINYSTHRKFFDYVYKIKFEGKDSLLTYLTKGGHHGC